jgi:hypothetical protein
MGNKIYKLLQILLGTVKIIASLKPLQHLLELQCQIHLVKN